MLIKNLQIEGKNVIFALDKNKIMVSFVNFVKNITPGRLNYHSHGFVFIRRFGVYFL